jgi:transcriptional regulator
MYIPAAFAETDLTKLHDFIEQNSFGLLVSQVDGLPFATHVPFLLERTTGPHGILVGHIARANPHWREAGDQTALAIFSGPHAVHAYGRVEVIEGEAALLDIVERSVRFYEEVMPRPWSFDASDSFVKRMLSQIVGFRIEIENHAIYRR